MNIKKILSIVLTLVMGIALTGVLATNINNVDTKNGYIELNNIQYDYLRIAENGENGFDVFDKYGIQIDEAGYLEIFAEDVYISDFSLDVEWDGAHPNVDLFNNNHKILDFEIEHTGTFEMYIIFNNETEVYNYTTNDNISAGEFTISANDTLKPITLTLLSFVPLIFTGAVVYFVYNSKFD